MYVYRCKTGGDVLYLALEGLGNLGNGVCNLVGLVAWLDQPQRGLTGQVGRQHSVSLPPSHLPGRSSCETSDTK